MDRTQTTQRQQLAALLDTQPIMRAYELRKAGIAPETISRAVHNGQLIRISRGLYQRADSEVETEQALAEAAKRVPKGVIAMVSALAFHGLTDQMPRKIWVAISARDWAPVPSYPPIRIVELRDRYMDQGIEHHRISGVDVPIFSVPKTLADIFRNRKLVDRSVAVEGLRAALDQRKATPGTIAEAAIAGDSWKIMRPYLEALTSNG
ncbi:transcriptional regulator [Mesorhizobium sp. M7A.T.Ca.TU.009.01.3.2]|uniref:type IV toxin-antitoxin system AbiEi family antitoxin domain-containing protein n=1 Tax=unclassified Mesorhizobium TaxID=325217 RepID=UPI0003CFDCCD|nr:MULTISPECIES: AbiEi antitoxin N-terminal domain-containing protein [unclassified Mesorhizobium]RUU12378.1 transcriptional regulator [Mesorhizobium sp. M7A.T.Ca.TU.009.01.3.2]RUU99360.1 transcriptional regulator [Mesorhizobium sp. M7A.T.Ca.TU.009.01.3.1]RUV53655.1 transcriptional regulator [Mesorhizobium sp. M7A.F.Ca.MR.228.00.0.0]RWO70322.1 MAG: transcriptional regulator [Mesorhizobium sp.]ESZ66069.1 transcriptional regulator [Mesorhizobium sp. L103C120A0]